jgi:hypothetical protein
MTHDEKKPRTWEAYASEDTNMLFTFDPSQREPMIPGHWKKIAVREVTDSDSVSVPRGLNQGFPYVDSDKQFALLERGLNRLELWDVAAKWGFHQALSRGGE